MICQTEKPNTHDKWKPKLTMVVKGRLKCCFQALLIIFCQIMAIGQVLAKFQASGQSDYSWADLIAYQVKPMSDDTKKQLQNLKPYQRQILEKINRADARHLLKLTELVWPEQWKIDELVYSPLPQIEPRTLNYDKAIVVDQRLQVFAAYEQGHMVRWGPVSTGRRSRQTPSGLFHLNWKSRGRHSTVNPSWFMPWYFNFDNARGLSMHAYSLPGYPASHACIRLLEVDAKWLYEWGESAVIDTEQITVLQYGTPLFIDGQYNFMAAPPWRSQHVHSKTENTKDQGGVRR